MLSAAEAGNEINDPDGNVHNLLNRVRGRARNGTAFPADLNGLSKTDFTNAVLEERRLELAFECKRWYDIARRKIGEEAFGPSGLEGEKPNFDPNQDYLFPLPADELARNPNLMPNNPGY